MTSQTGLSPQYQKWKTSRLLKEKSPCACGCGELATHGNKFIHGHYNKIWFPFDKAKEIVRCLNCKSLNDYVKLSKEGKLPSGIPSSPEYVYKKKGWINWYDYLGKEQPTKLLPFKEAKEKIQLLKLSNYEKFRELRKQGKIPKGIPAAPDRIYKNKGWKDWADFLGKKPYHTEPLQYEEAKRIIQSMNIHSEKKLRESFKQREIPIGIPYSPYVTYKGKGWISYADYFGIKPRLEKPLPFDKARELIQKLRIQSAVDYYKLSRDRKLPNGLPPSPSVAYRNKGWISWYDFLGNESPIEPLPFREAVKIVRKMGIKSSTQYFRLHAEGKLPKGLPNYPDEVYAKVKRKRKGK